MCFLLLNVHHLILMTSKKTQDKFDILYKDEKEYEYLNYILSYNEKEILVVN